MMRLARVTTRHSADRADILIPAAERMLGGYVIVCSWHVLGIWYTCGIVANTRWDAIRAARTFRDNHSCI